MLCWQAHCSLWGHGRRRSRCCGRPLWKAGATAGVVLVGGARGRARSGQCGGPCLQISLGHWAPGAMPSPSGPGPKAKPMASLGQPRGPGLAQQAALSSARRPHTPRAPPQGRWPRTASSCSRGWTPLGGLESCLLSCSTASVGSAGKGTAGCSWELRLQPPTAQAPMPKPYPQQTTAQPRRGQEAAPGRAVCSWVPGLRHNSAVCDPRSHSTKVRPRTQTMQL